jgi:hypothetical protein
MPEDWYRNDHIVAYGHWRSILLDKLLWLIKPLKNGHKPVGFKDSMLLSALKLKRRWTYFHLEHMPHPLKKSMLEVFFTKNPAFFVSNISHKFRSAKQFNTQALYYMLMFDANKAIQTPTNNVFLYLKPVNRGVGYITRKLSTFEQQKDIKFCCMGSLDMATEADRKELLLWMQKLLKIEF